MRTMSTTEEQIADEMSADEGTPDGIDPETGEITDPEAAGVPPAPESPAPRSQKEIDALMEKLRSEDERHEKRVRDLMGDDFALLVRSPVDWTPGYIFNVPGMLPEPEQVAQLDAILGRGAAAELREAEDAEGCDKCSALGEVLTGSRKPGQETKPCSACNGTGWKTRLQMPPSMSIPVAYANGSDGTAPPPNQPIVADRWGRPFGHLHYGMEPANVGT